MLGEMSLNLWRCGVARWLSGVFFVLSSIGLVGCHSEPAKPTEVIVYTALDEEFSQRDFRLRHVLLVKRLAQLESRGVGHLPGIWRIRYTPVCRDVSHEPAVSGDEAYNHAVAARLGIHLDVFVTPGGI